MPQFAAFLKEFFMKEENKVQAVMLAAGQGKRLGEYTQNNTKCMVQVGGKTLLEHTVAALKQAGIHKLIMVVGYQKESLKAYIKEHIKDIEVVFIDNDAYQTSNNIFSLSLARSFMENEDTILLESDVIYEKKLIADLVLDPNENLAVVAKYEQWMDGTVVLVDKQNRILEFVDKQHFTYENAAQYYKTVNIYKFSKAFSKNQYFPFLEAYMQVYGKNEYYEAALKAVAYLSSSGLKAFDVKDTVWYEIDDPQDLHIANVLFSKGEEKLKNYQKSYGGYWRFSKIKDFCYLVNPYFPPQKMYDKLNYFLPTLISTYPSGMNIQASLAQRLFQVNPSYMLMGNGAAELINGLGSLLNGKTLLHIPTFYEYIRCFSNCEFIYTYSKDHEYGFDVEKILSTINTQSIDQLFLISPDNPTGAMICKEDMMNILDACAQNGVLAIIDESFIDFADSLYRYTLLDNQVLEKYNNLVVVKSISKSYGVAGLRLGVLATANQNLYMQLKKKLSIWNINSFGEYFMQIYPLFEKDYWQACDRIAEERNQLLQRLREIPYMKKVYPSQANYILCELDEKTQALDLTVYLLDECQIFIKDLTGKEGFDSERYIRLAVRNKEDNELLIKALKSYSK